VRTATRRALVTGVSGFVGSHLAEHLLATQWEVHGFDCVADPRARLRDVRLHQGDLLDFARIEEVLADCRPSHVFHLAALRGADSPARLYELNVVGTAHLFTAMRTTKSPARVLLTSSSAVYGQAETLPIGEAAVLRPTTDYAASKAAQEMVAVANQSQGMDVVRVRPFNLIGPRQPEGLVIAAIAKQIVTAERAGGGVVRIGNTTTRRDYTDVRDAVRAYVAVAENRSLREVYNVCSGRSVTIRECLDLLIAMSSVSLRVESDAGRVRRNDIQEQVGSPARIEAATGWRPRIPLGDSLAAVLDWGRSGLP